MSGLRGVKCAILLLLLGTAPAVAQAPDGKVLVNVNRQGVALQGYDAVAFFTDSMAVRGVPAQSARHGGATYYFATAEHLAAFLAAPEKYVPGFGGFCAYGASQNHAAPVEIRTWQIINGRLILNYDAGVQRKFNRDQATYLSQAEANWPGLVAKEGKLPSP